MAWSNLWQTLLNSLILAEEGKISVITLNIWIHFFLLFATYQFYVFVHFMSKFRSDLI